MHIEGNVLGFVDVQGYESSISTSGAGWFSLQSSVPGKVSGFQEGLSAWCLENWLSVRGWFEQPR